MWTQVIPSEWYLILGTALFGIGLLGVLIRRNVVIVLMSIEVMLNAINLILVSSSAYRANLSAQVFVFFIMMVAAVEVAVGLAIFTVIYRRKQSTDIDALTELKG